MIFVLILIFSVIVFSGLFSGTEAALFSVPLSRAEAFVKEKRKGARTLVKIKERSSRPIAVIVIFNNIVNIVGSILVGVVTTKVLGDAWIGGISAILTLLVIMFGEIVPKSIGERHAERISLALAPILYVLTKIFSPILWGIEKITGRFQNKKVLVSEEEIKILSHMGHLGGSIEKDEDEMIRKVFRLNDLYARDIMTPRSKVFSLDVTKSLADVEEDIYKSTYSRLPLYKGSKNSLVGFCLRDDLLAALGKDLKNKKLAVFKRKLPRVLETTRVDFLLLYFRRNKYLLAAVRDKKGDIVGVVSLEDIIEQLVGDIFDERDRIRLNSKIK